MTGVSGNDRSAGAITARTSTKVGAWLLRSAKQLAQKLSGSGPAACKYLIVDGFIIQAKRFKQLRTAVVFDSPGFILLCGQVQVSDGIQIGDTAVQAGTRDDFARATEAGLKYEGMSLSAKRSGSNSPRFLIQPSAAIDDGIGVISIAPVRQYAEKLSLGKFSAPVNSSGLTGLSSLDDLSVFTFTHIAGVGGLIALPHITARAAGFNADGNFEISPFAGSYFNSVNHVVLESALADGWKFHPRRQVAHTEYSLTNDGYRARIAFNVTPGFVALPAKGRELKGVDKFCLAARVFRQHIGTWYEAEPGESYRPRYYDRHGEQGMLVSVAEFYRADYDPSGAPVNAAIIDQYRVMPVDIPVSGLQPLPAFLPSGPYGKPSLPNFGQFLTPHPVATGAGFVVFSVYSTLRDGTADGPAGAYGKAYGLVATLPDHTCIVRMADWDADDDTPLIQTASAGEFVQPWIVGVESISVEAGALVTVTGYCLVWEQAFHRKPVAAVDRGIGGRWVLYVTDGIDAARQVLAGPGAPLFAPKMSIAPKDDHYDQSIGEPFSSLCQISKTQMVTAAIQTPHAMPSQTQPRTSIAEHDVYCAVVNIETGSVELRGVIAQRSSTFRKCFISCAQMEAPATSSPLMSAVLIATMVDHLTGNGGNNGKVYISIDSGNSWSEYIGDIGGQCGAFYVGNKMWLFDNTLPLTVGGANETPA